MREFLDIVATWQTRKREVFAKQAYQNGSNAKSLREFVEIQNALSRKLMSLMDNRDPDFWESLMELGINTARICEKGKVFVNKQDVTNEGM